MDHVIQQLLIITIVTPLGGGGPNTSLQDFLSFDWLDCITLCLLTTGVEWGRATEPISSISSIGRFL